MTELERLHDACLIENLRSASRPLQGYDLRRHEPGDRESAPSRGMRALSLPSPSALRVGFRPARVFSFRASDTSILPNFALHRVGDSSTVERRTLTPSILVRIQVPQPSTSWSVPDT